MRLRVANRAHPSARLAVGTIVVGVAILRAGAALANGDDFFIPENDGPPVLLYFGHVRDSDGNPVGGAVLFFEQKHPVAYVRAKTFPDGGYQSPDLGVYIQALGSGIDFSKIGVRCLKEGYVIARPTVPENQVGRVPFDIVMVKVR